MIQINKFFPSNKRFLCKCTDHSDSFQVHFGPAELLPAVVFVTLAFGHPAVFSSGFKYITNQWTPADLIRRDLHAFTVMNNVLNIYADWVFMYQMHVVKYLWVSGVFWTENLQSLTVGFALWIVNITEEPCSTIFFKKKNSRNNETSRLCANILFAFVKGIKGALSTFSRILQKQLTVH